MTMAGDYKLKGTEGQYEVCLEEDGIRACLTINSMHEMPQIQSKLKAAIRRQAFQSMIEAQSQCVCDI